VTAAELLAYLDSLGIASSTVEHPPVFTVDEAARLRGDLPGTRTKALFLRSRDGRLWILVTIANRRPDLRGLSAVLGCGRLSFASRDDLSAHLGVVPGAVSPFAVVSDADGMVQVVLDAALLTRDQLGFHPLANSMTTTVSPDGLIRFLESVDHPPTIVELPYA
jgi:Ala-tRNA(Pro) deacylase